MSARWSLPALAAISALTMARPASADPPTASGGGPTASDGTPTVPPSRWGLVYRRACRSYAPPRDPVFDRRGRTMNWCMGRFSVADGRYLGAVPFDLEPARLHLPDGRDLAAREIRLHAGDPARWQIVTVSEHGRRVVPLAASLTDLRRAALSVRGESAVVTRGDGQRAVVTLPTGRAVLPLAPGDAETRAALSADGARLALASARSVAIYDVSGAAPRRVGLLSERRAAVAFADDGRTLLVARGDGTLLSAWREGTADARPPTAAVHLALGNGETTVPAPDGWLPHQDPSIRPSAAPRAEHGLASAWRRLYGGHAGTSDARVYVTEAGEFADYTGRSTGWGRALMERYADGGYDPGTLRVWRAPGGREAEWRTRRPVHGGTPGDWWTTVRVAEVGDALYRVEVDRIGECPAADHACAQLRVESLDLVTDLITEPFGAAAPEESHRHAR